MPKSLYVILLRDDGGKVASAQHIEAENAADAVQFGRRNGGSFDVLHGETTLHTERSRVTTPATSLPMGKWSGTRLGEAHVAYLDFADKVERRRQDGQSISPVYRIYLRDAVGTVVSGHTIAVEANEVAINVAATLCHACATASFEVWRGEALLIDRRSADTPPSREELSQRTQQIVVDNEIALRDNHQALAESRRLLNAIDEWQQREPISFVPLRKRQ